MSELSKEIMEFVKNGDKIVKEIMEEFNIPLKRKATLIRRLKDNNVKLRENRGRKKIQF